jgi:hypothetical protein
MAGKVGLAGKRRAQRTETRMSGPQGQDPNQAWSPSGHQAPGSEDPSTWQPPAYPQSEPTPTEAYPTGEQYPNTAPYAPSEQYPNPGQYTPSEQQYPTSDPYPGAAPQYQYGQPTGYDPGTPYAPPGAQFGEPPPPIEGQQPKDSKRSGALLAMIGVLIAVIVAAVAVTGFWKPGFFVTTKLDVDKAREGVQTILTDQVNGYGLKDVKDVKCNKGENPKVEKGKSFDCDATVEGLHKKVTVTFQDDSGTYEVGRPKSPNK